MTEEALEKNNRVNLSGQGKGCNVWVNHACSASLVIISYSPARPQNMREYAPVRTCSHLEALNRHSSSSMHAVHCTEPSAMRALSLMPGVTVVTLVCACVSDLVQISKIFSTCMSKTISQELGVELQCEDAPGVKIGSGQPHDATYIYQCCRVRFPSHNTHTHM